MCVYVAVIRFLHVFIVRFGHVYVTLAMAYVFARYAHFMLSSRLPRHAASLPFKGAKVICVQKTCFSTILSATNNKYRLLSAKDVSHVSEVFINLCLLFTHPSLFFSFAGEFVNCQCAMVDGK